MISSEIGILHHIMKLPRMNGDPKMVNYGIWPCNTEYLSVEKYGGRSAGCGFKWEDAILGTLGETVERYASAFYNYKKGKFTSFNKLGKHSIPPKEYALFHQEQFKDERFKIKEFTKEIELTWIPTIDLTDGKETWSPAQFIYLPFNQDETLITLGTSTGLAAHTNYYKAILNGLYESIERDSFVLTWMQNLVPEKLVISVEIRKYIESKFPTIYDWHFFDISYDINVPTVLGFCFGEAEYGKFVAVGSSSRATYGEALKKVIQEIGQAIPYFRYLLGEKKKWKPTDDFTLIQDFEDHSIFYLLRQDLWYLFDKWKNAKETKQISLTQKVKRTDQEEIKHILKILKDKNYNVLFKDITTHDIRQLGFFSVKIFVPQLIQLAGAYPFYFLGGKRLYSVPEQMGYVSNDFHHLNKYPHPFP